MNVAKDTAVLAGKATWVTAKTTGKILYAAGKGIKTLIEIPMGVTRVKLSGCGNSYMVTTVLNRKVKARMMLDTGAASTLITQRIGRALGISESAGRKIVCTLAGGQTAAAREVTISSVKVGRAYARNVRAVILEDDRTKGYDGLLGMDFLNNFKFKIDTEKNELILEKRG